MDSAIATFFRKNFQIQHFNVGIAPTDKPSSRLIKCFDRSACCVCGTTENVTVAHILKHRDSCAAIGLPWDASNFIPLCGTRGVYGSCHHLFDTFQMSFIYTKSASTWSVVGGGIGKHNKAVIFPTQPHKLALHTHLARCIVIKSITPEQCQLNPEIEGEDQLEDSGEINSIPSSAASVSSLIS